MGEEVETREARARRLRPLVKAALRDRHRSRRKAAGQIGGWTHASLSAFLRPDKPSIPYDESLDRLEAWLAADEQADPADPAVRLAGLLERQRSVAQLLSRLAPGEVLTRVYEIATEWPEAALHELDAVAVELLRRPTGVAALSPSDLSARLRDDLRQADRLARLLGVIPPQRVPGDSRRRPRRAGGGADGA